MGEFMLQYEIGVRIFAFASVFLVMAGWEIFAPFRRLSTSKPQRWMNNMALIALDTLLIRFLFPAAAIGVAGYTSLHGWGVFHLIDWPEWLEILLAIVLLDLAIYLQHVMFHAIPTLWRLHRVHHADPDYDVTTGARFHPIEIILSMLIKLSIIVMLGPAMLAVLLFEILLNATAMFNHANVHLPERLDKALRWIVVTPDMHRVHHSVEEDEANSNFGFNLPWWDRLFDTYRAEPRYGQDRMTIGIIGFQMPELTVRLTGMLILPFVGSIQNYAINRRGFNKSEVIK